MKIDENKIAYCRKLYLENGGRYHYLIEKSMREVGYSFARRCLYRNGKRPGWIVKYGFREGLNSDKGRVTRDKISDEGRVASDERSVLAAVANGAFVPVDSVPCPSVVNEKGEATNNTEHTQHSSLVTRHSSLTELSFEHWLKATSPTFTWDWAYQKLIYDKLRDVTAGKTKRLMIFLPPRHGKSELVTVRYAAWILQKDPTLNIIVGSYNQKLANKFSRKIKNVLSDAEQMRRDKGRGTIDKISDEGRVKNSDEGRVTSDEMSVTPAVAGGFTRRKEKAPVATAHGTDPEHARSSPNSPNSLNLPNSPRPINTAEEWETRQGGGVRAVGVGGGITGYGAGLIIIDDPIKSRSEAESKTIRDKVSDWFDDDLYTRLEPEAPIILIQTRWHEDDLAGRLLKEMEEQSGEKWEVISLPAIAEEEPIAH